MLENGIEPLVTLYHWDLPAALDDRGGWLNPDIAELVRRLCGGHVPQLDGRVKKWVTLNEPWVVSDGGYLHGALAPGHRNRFEAPIASHNLLRAHGAAVQAYRAEGQHQIGLVVNFEPKYKASDDPADIAATARADAYMNRQYLDPAILGSYPEEMAEIFGEAWPDWPAHDLALIRQPIDFLGVNYYTRNVTRFDPNAWPLKARAVRQKQSTYTETGWEVFAPALTDTLLWVKRRYGEIPLYVTENGAAFFDPPTAPKGGIKDALRVDYLREHIARYTTLSSRVSTCAATWSGRCSTTSNGRSAIRSASGSCTWTSKASGGRRRTARTSIRKSSPATEPFLAQKQCRRATSAAT